MPDTMIPSQLTASLDEVSARVAALELAAQDPAAATNEGMSLIVFSGELDRLLAAFTIATGAAASGVPTTMFFTFWGTAALRGTPAPGKRSLLDRMFGAMVPAGATRARLSRLDCLGVGRRMMARQMQAKGVPGLTELIELAAECGVEIMGCESAMAIMGIQRDDLIDYPGLTTCGVARFIELSRDRTTMFI